MNRLPLARLAAWLLALIAASSSPVWACASCFGKSDSALARGMNMGIFVLLGVIGCVLAGIAGVGVYFARRGARVNRENAQSESVRPLANV